VSFPYRNLAFTLVAGLAIGSGCKTGGSANQIGAGPPLAQKPTPGDAATASNQQTANARMRAYAKKKKEARTEAAKPASVTGSMFAAWDSSKKAVAGFFASKPKAQSAPKDDPTSLSHRPGKPTVEQYLTIGRQFENGGRYAKAAELYEKARRVAPNDPHPREAIARVHVLVARQFEDKKQFGDARQQYEAALRLAPRDHTALISYGRLLTRMGLLDDARRVYTAAVTAHPKSAIAANDLGLCLANQGRVADAVRRLEQAVRLHPKRTMYRNNLAAVLVDAGHTRLAAKHLGEVHRPAVVYYNLGYLVSHRGRKDEAVSYLKEALRLEPGLADAQRLLARLDGQQADGEQVARRNGQTEQRQPSRPAAGSRPTGQRAPAPTPPAGPSYLHRSDAGHPPFGSLKGAIRPVSHESIESAPKWDHFEE